MQHDDNQTAGSARRPEASDMAKVLVWGGVLLGVAGLTAGTILATRKVSDLLAGDSPQPPRNRAGTLAPRFADLDEDEREMVRVIGDGGVHPVFVGKEPPPDAVIAARRRAEAARRRHAARPASLSEIAQTASGLTAGVNGLAAALSGAFHGFRSVAAEASTVIGEFAAAAKQIRGLMDQGRAAAQRGHDAREPRE